MWRDHQRAFQDCRPIAGLLLTIATLQALNIAFVSSSELRKLLSNVFQAAVALMTLVAMVRAVQRLRQEDSEYVAGWRLFTVASGFWAAGMVLFLFVESVLKRPAYPGVPDFFFLSFYPIMIAGLWRLPREPLGRAERWNNVLDVAALAVVAVLVIWQFNLRLLVRTLEAQPNPGTWVSLGYTFVDTLLLLMIFSRLVRKLGQGLQFVPMLLLVVGCFFLITADLLQGYVTTYGNFSSGSPIDLGWVLFSTFLGFAALHVLKHGNRLDPNSPAGVRLESFRTFWTLAVTYLWIALVLVLMVWALFNRDKMDVRLLILGVFAATVLAITRQVRTLKENARLYRKLLQSATSLEARVQERTAELEKQRALLAESEVKFRELFERSPDGVLVADICGQILDANPAACALQQLTREEVIGRNLLDLVPSELQPQVSGEFPLWLSGDLTQSESTLLTDKGERVRVEIRGTLIHYRGRAAVLLHVRDVTERKRGEEALRVSERRLDLALDVARAEVWDLNLQTGQVTMDAKSLRRLGYEPGEIATTVAGLAALQHPEDQPRTRAALEALIRGETETYRADFRNRKKDGSWAWTESSGRVAERAPDGTALRVIGVAIDITERKQAEQVVRRLSQLGQQLSAATDATKAAEAVADAADELIGWDACFVKLRSPDRAEATYVLSADLVNGERQKLGKGPGREITVIEQRVMDHGPQLILREHPEKEERFVMFGDESRPAASLMYVPLLHHGRYLGLFSIHSYRRQAYTAAHLSLLQALAEYAAGAFERLRAETALSQSERRFQELFEHSPDAILVADGNGILQDVNATACRKLGWERAALIGKSLIELVPDADRPAVARDLPRWLTGEIGHGDGIALTADGRRMPVEIRGAPVRYAEEAGLLLHVRDMTERKHAEAQIQQQAALLSASHDAILVWSPEGGVEFLNPAAENLLGQKPEQVLGKDLAVALKPRAELALQAAIQAVMTHGSWTGELVLQPAEGKARTVSSRWITLKEPKGRPVSVLITCNDITEQKQLEAQYLRAQRLESVGTLASGVAHDLNNILSPILMGVDMLQQTIQDAEAREFLAMMKDSARRGSDTVKQLLTFSRGTEAQKGPVQPRHLLKEITRLLQQTFPKNIQIYSDFAGEPATVLADPSQLHQVMMNLCVNARDAMPEGGVLFLSLENVAFDVEAAMVHPKARPIAYVVFKVSDSGTGIPPEVLDRIFDPFFTTKPQGKGTGLGLSTVLGLVENHDGFVLVDSEPGKGTVFRVHLPAGVAPVAREETEEVANVPRGSGELVLVVDDEPAIVRLTENLLRRGGYQTLGAKNASEAMLQYEKHFDRIKIVVTDVMMPFGDGRQLILLLYARDPKLPIVAMSGLATTDFQRDLVKRGACAFVAKPFKPGELLGAVAQALMKNGK